MALPMWPATRDAGHRRRIEAPTSSTTDSPRTVGHTAAMAGRSMPGIICRCSRDIAISAPVLPAETATSASPFLTASIASHIEDDLRPRRRAWLGFSSMLIAMVGMKDPRDGFQRRVRIKLLVNQGAVAEQQKFDVGVPHQGERCARNNHRCTEIAAHGVKRDSNLLRHKRPGNLIVAASKQLAAS